MRTLVSRLVDGDGLFDRRRAADWLYRYLRPDPRLWRSWIEIRPLGPLSERLRGRFPGGEVTIDSLREALVEGEEYLVAPPPSLGGDLNERSVAVSPRRPTEHPIVDRMRRQLGGLEGKATVFVHGSMATGDYTPCSDVDDFVVVHPAAWRTPESFRDVALGLERVARSFQQHDPLQHHGHWVFLEHDLACLDESTMPLVVLEQASTVVGSSRLHARVRAAPRQVERVLWHVAQDVRNSAVALAENGRLDLFSLKDLVSSVSLLPALVCQLRGESVAKKAAIDRSRQLFSTEAAEAVAWSTAVRQAWPPRGSARRLRRLAALGGRVPARRSVLEHVARTAAGSAYVEALSEDPEALPGRLFALSDECVAYLRRARCA